MSLYCGWKRIAARLGVSSETAKAWEKKGLPVHRPAGGRGSVFAVEEELLSWITAG